jgi:hypothetical protein
MPCPKCVAKAQAQAETEKQIKEQEKQNLVIKKIS